MINFILPGILIFISIYFILKFILPLIEKASDNSYVGYESFPTDVEFEILRQSKTRNVLNHFFSFPNQNKINGEFLIASDYKSVLSAISSNESIQDYIRLIFSHPQAHSIVVQDNHIRVRLKYRYTGKGNTAKPYVADILNPLKHLRTTLLQSINNHTDSPESKKTAKQKTKLIYLIQILYGCLFFASMGQFIYTDSFYSSSVMLIDSFGFVKVFSVALIYFSLIVSCVVFKLWGSARIHNLYWKSLYLLLPSCLFLSYHTLYSANFILDASELTVVQVAHDSYISSGKSKNYYYVLPENSQYKITKSNIAINLATFITIRDYEKSEVTFRQGGLGVRYLTNIKPIGQEKQ